MAQLVVERGRRGVERVEPVFEGPRFFHCGVGFVVFAGLFECADLLAQLVAASFELLRLGDGLAAALVERQEIPQQRGWIGVAQAQLVFDQSEVVAYKIQVQHGSFSLLDAACAAMAPRRRRDAVC